MLIFTMVIPFLVVWLATVVLGLISVPAAYLVRSLVPRYKDVCSRYIDGWRTQCGLRRRVLWIPLVIAVAGLTTLGLFESVPIKHQITQADRLVVRTGGNCHRDPSLETVLFETTDKETIEAFAGRISVNPTFFYMGCLCCGEMTFDLYRKTKISYSFSLHHDEHIRIQDEFDEFYGDKSLSLWSRLRLGMWFDETGITEALPKARERERELEKNGYYDMK